mgnify:CR=1 FL=1
MLTVWLNKYKYTLILILIIIIAVFFRFWQFNSIPPGLYQDEAMNGADALSSLENGNFDLFYTNNNGREGMIIWLDALSIKLLGTETWVLRLFPTLAGVLSVLGLYFLTKKLFTVEIALASSFFMAISFWAVNFSRIGFRAGLMLPFLIWSFYFLLRGFKTENKIYNFIAAGVLFGLGFYTYISYRFTPILAAMFFIFHFTKYGAKNFWLKFAIFSVTTFIVALPIGLYFLNNPSDFLGRSGQVSIFRADNPLKAFVLSAAATFGMFNIIGDFNWRHNFAGSPLLFWPVGILFLLGIYLALKEVRFQKYPKSDFGYKFMLAWLGIFLLPNILSTEGNPHALRALGVMPAVMIFAGIGLVWLYQKCQEYLAYRGQFLRIKKEVFILLIIFLLFISFSEFNKYFVRWASNIKTAEAFSQNQVKIADYLNATSKDIKKYVIWSSDDRPTGNDLPVSAQTVFFLTYKKYDINYVKSNEIDRINLELNNAIVIPIYFDLELLHYLNKKFSASKIEFIDLNTPILIVP